MLAGSAILRAYETCRHFKVDMHSKELTKPDGRHLTLYSNEPIPDRIGPQAGNVSIGEGA